MNDIILIGLDEQVWPYALQRVWNKSYDNLGAHQDNEHVIFLTC